jgi:hypothetical protein
MPNLKSVSIKLAILIGVVSICYLGIEQYQSYSWNENCKLKAANNIEHCNYINRSSIKIQYYWIQFMFYAVPTSIGIGLLGIIQGFVTKK